MGLHYIALQIFFTCKKYLNQYTQVGILNHKKYNSSNRKKWPPFDMVVFSIDNITFSSLCHFHN
jgi:hypothetical protein